MPKTKTEEKKISLKPLMGYVLIEPDKAETTTASGIILPDSAKEQPAQGKVLRVGAPLYHDGQEILAPVEVGDKVVYKKWAGDELRLDGKDYKLVRFDEIMGVFVEE